MNPYHLGSQKSQPVEGVGRSPTLLTLEYTGVVILLVCLEGFRMFLVVTYDYPLTQEVHFGQGFSFSSRIFLFILMHPDHCATHQWLSETMRMCCWNLKILMFSNSQDGEIDASICSAKSRMQKRIRIIIFILFLLVYLWLLFGVGRDKSFSYQQHYSTNM